MNMSNKMIDTRNFREVSNSYTGIYKRIAVTTNDLDTCREWATTDPRLCFSCKIFRYFTCRRDHNPSDITTRFYIDQSKLKEDGDPNGDNDKKILLDVTDPEVTVTWRN